MSRYQETLLANQLARLDQTITDAQDLASRSSDEATQKALEKELFQLHETRQQIEAVWRRTKSLNQAVRRTLVIFCLSFVALFVLGFSGLFHLSPPLYVVLILLDSLILVASGITYVVVILLRDAIVRGHRPWRFSLWELLVVTTIVAVLLSLVVYVRKL